jgi:hypothetical protein
MRNLNHKIELAIVIKSHLNDAEIEKSFNAKLAFTRCKFVNLLLAKNSTTEMVTDKYLQSVWKVAEVNIQNPENHIQSYSDFMLDQMLDKVSGGW